MLHSIFRSAERKVYRKGEALFYQGSSGSEFWIMIKGEASVYRNREKNNDNVIGSNPLHFVGVGKVHNDRSEVGVLTARLYPGEGFGQTGILLASKRVTSVVADGYQGTSTRLEDTEAVVIPREGMDYFVTIP